MDINEKQLKMIIEAVATKLQQQEQGKPNSIKKIPPTPIDKIPDIIKKMSANEIKNFFGLDIGNNKENPYKCLQKKFIENYNITTDNKFKPRLTMEHKHLIIRQLIRGKPKKEQQKVKDMCINYLKQRISNPPSMLYGKPATPKQQEHIIDNYKKELERWQQVKI